MKFRDNWHKNQRWLINLLITKKVFAHNWDLHTKEDCMRIRSDFSTVKRLHFLVRTTMICLEKQDYAALEKNGIPVYQNVKVSLFLRAHCWSWLLNMITQASFQFATVVVVWNRDNVLLATGDIQIKARTLDVKYSLIQLSLKSLVLVIVFLFHCWYSLGRW